MALSHCSSESNHKLSKSSQPLSVTSIIVLWFFHLFSIVRAGSPSMTWKTIKFKGFVPECEQIYFRYRYRGVYRVEWMRKYQFSCSAFGWSFNLTMTHLLHNVHQIFKQ